MLDFEAAIFDLDGTLLDSMGVWERIDHLFLGKRGLKVPPGYMDEIAPLTFRETAEYTIARFNLTDTPEALMAEWNDMALYEYANNVMLKPGAREYLIRLKALGVKLGTATCSAAPLSGAALKNLGLHELFDAQCGADEAGRGKEYPDIFLLAAKKLGARPEACVVFEDLLPGIRSAKKAGMRVYCIRDSYSEHQAAEITQIADGYLQDFFSAPGFCAANTMRRKVAHK